MFKVQTAANSGKKPAITKEYVQAKPTEYLWNDFMRQVGSYARKTAVINKSKNRGAAAQCWYNNTPQATV